MRRGQRLGRGTERGLEYCCKGACLYSKRQGTNKFYTEMVQPGSLARVQHEYNDHVLHIR